MIAKHGLSRRLFLGAGSALVAASLVACGNTADPEPAASSEHGAVIEHKYGETTVPADPQRVVSVGANDIDTMLALGTVPVGNLYWYGASEDGVWPWARELAGDQTIEAIGDMSGVNLEKIASLEPDLIIGTYTGMTEQQYEQLSEIAPTVAQPADYPDWGVPWDVQAVTIGKALGKEDQAQQLVGDLQAKVEEVRAAHPEFEGKKIVVGAFNDPGFGIYGTADPKVRFFNALGFENMEFVENIEDEQWGEISEERLAEIDADVIVWYASEDFKPLLEDALSRSETYQNLTAVKEGRTVVIADDAAQALAWSDILSLSYALDEIPGRVAEVLK